MEGKYSLDIFYSNLDSLRRVSQGAHLIAAGFDRYPAASETENRWSGLMPLCTYAKEERNRNIHILSYSAYEPYQNQTNLIFDQYKLIEYISNPNNSMTQQIYILVKLVKHEIIK